MSLKESLLTCFVLTTVGVLAKPWSSLSPSDQSAYVNGGNTVLPGARRYMAHLQISERDDENVIRTNSCGGTVVDKTHILTAAHCFIGKVTAVNVYLGIHTIKPMDSSFILRKVGFSNAAIHEGYHIEACRYDENYIALVTIPSIEEYLTSKLITAVEVSSTTTIPDGTNAWVVGWGRITASPDSRAASMQEGKINISKDGTCSVFVFPYLGSQMCSIQKHVSCVGDSGGPVMAGNVQIGIVSYGRNLTSAPMCSGEGTEIDVFTRVGFFKDWIAKKLAAKQDSHGVQTLVKLIK